MLNETYRQGDTINLIVTDWNMPIVGGEEFIKELQEKPLYKMIPIIISSSSSIFLQISDVYKSLTSFIKKPYTQKELKQFICEFITDLDLES